MPTMGLLVMARMARISWGQHARRPSAPPISTLCAMMRMFCGPYSGVASEACTLMMVLRISLSTTGFIPHLPSKCYIFGFGHLHENAQRYHRGQRQDGGQSRSNTIVAAGHIHIDGQRQRLCAHC